MEDYSALKQEVYTCNMEIPKRELALYTWGNVSAIDREKGVIAIKPSGVSYDELRPEDIVIVDMNNQVIQNEAGRSLRPSSDTLTHVVLYKAFSEIGGIVHTHSPYAVGWSQTCMPIPIYGTTHADHLTHNIPCTAIMRDDQIQGNYEEETGKQILETFSSLNPKEVEMVLVACHGPFTWGKTAAKAVYNAVVLEELAKMAFITHTIRPETESLKQTLRDKHYLRKHGEHAYYGQK